MTSRTAVRMQASIVPKCGRTPFLLVPPWYISHISPRHLAQYLGGQPPRRYQGWRKLQISSILAGENFWVADCGCRWARGVTGPRRDSEKKKCRLSKVPRRIAACLSVWVGTTSATDISLDKKTHISDILLSGWGVWGQMWRRWRCGSRSWSWRTWAWSPSWTSTRPSLPCRGRQSASR